MIAKLMTELAKENSLISTLKSRSGDPQFQPILSYLPELIFQINKDGIFLDFYAAHPQLLAFPVESISGNTIGNLFAPALAEQAMKCIKESLQTQCEVVFEYTLDFDTGARYFEAKLIPEDAESVTAFIKDITEKKNIGLIALERNRLVEESEQKFRLLAENLPGAVYLCRNDENYSMLYLNDSVKEITGYSPQEFISAEINFPQLYHPDDKEHIYERVDDSLAKKVPFHIEYRLRNKSGDYRWIEEFGSGVFVGEELIYLEGYLQDITNRKETEKKILENNSALIKANKELDRFVYSASHDLRSPLTSLQGLVNLAARSTSAEDTEMLLKLMKERIDSLDKFIIDIATYAQNERLEVQEDNINLFNLITDCLDGIRYAEEAANVDFQILVPKDFQLTADQMRLKVVLNNLLSNAIKYGDRAKPHQFVKIEAKEMVTEYVISISDNGIGIEKQYQPNVFNMFYRASDKSKGSGLGLYIVKETIQKMNGAITLVSEFAKGSEFRISVPKKM